MDICMKIVDAVKTELKMPNLEVKLNPVTSATRIPLMANGTVDLECGSTTNNLDRQKQVSFTTRISSPRIATWPRSVEHQDAGRPQGQDGRVDVGTTNLKWLTEENGKQNLGMSILTAKDHAEAFLMVKPTAHPRFHGRHPARQPGGGREDAGRLRDRQRGLFDRAVRDHAAPGRPGVPEGRRRRNRPVVQKRRDHADLREVVPEAGSAEEHQPQPSGSPQLKNEFANPTNSGDPAVYK